MSSKDKTFKPVPGLELLNPRKLDPMFSRFSNDYLYFISQCEYDITSIETLQRRKLSLGADGTAGSSDGKRAASSSSFNYVPRCLALTPCAFFITDFNGKMDRASRFSSIVTVIAQPYTKKKLLFSEKRMHFVIKFDTEPDCHFTIDASGEIHGRFVYTLVKVIEFTRGDGKLFKVKMLSLETPIEKVISTEPPKGYLSPVEIITLNTERRFMVQSMKQVKAEIDVVREEIDKIIPEIKAKDEELKEYSKNADKSGLSKLQRTRDELYGKRAAMQKTQTILEIDVKKLTADNARLQEQLEDERANFETLVEINRSDSDSVREKEQQKIIELRRKAQQREVDSLTHALDEVNLQLAMKPVYIGPQALANKAMELELAVDKAVANWESEMDSVNKLDLFLMQMINEAEKLNRHLDKLINEKNELIDKIDPAATSNPSLNSSPPIESSATPASDDKVNSSTGGSGAGGAVSSSSSSSTNTSTKKDTIGKESASPINIDDEKTEDRIGESDNKGYLDDDFDLLRNTKAEPTAALGDRNREENVRKEIDLSDDDDI